MSEDTQQSKTLIDDIYEELLDSLKKTGEFDDLLLTQLSASMKNGDIRKYQKVSDLLKSVEKGKK